MLTETFYQMPKQSLGAQTRYVDPLTQTRPESTTARFDKAKFLAEHSTVLGYSLDQAGDLVSEFFAWIRLQSGWGITDICDGFVVHQAPTGFKTINGQKIFAINETSLELPIALDHPMVAAIRVQRWLFGSTSLANSDESVVWVDLAGHKQQSVSSLVEQAAKLLWVEWSRYVDHIGVYSSDDQAEHYGFLDGHCIAGKRLLALSANIPEHIDPLEIALHLMMHTLISHHKRRPYLTAPIQQAFHAEPTDEHLTILRDLYARSYALAVYTENIGSLSAKRSDELLAIMIEQIRCLPSRVQLCVARYLLSPLHASL